MDLRGVITIIETLKELRNEIGVTYQSGYAMTNKEIKDKLSEVISKLTDMDGANDDGCNKMNAKMLEIDMLLRDITESTEDLEDELKEKHSLTDDSKIHISIIERKAKEIEKLSDEVQDGLHELGYVLD